MFRRTVRALGGTLQPRRLQEVSIDSEIQENSLTSWREEVGSLLRTERERRGWEIEDVAERLKLRSSFVSAVEDGRGWEHMDEAYEWSHIKAIAGILGVELEARQ